MSVKRRPSPIRPLLLILALAALFSLARGRSGLEGAGARAEGNEVVLVELSPGLQTIPPAAAVTLALDSGTQAIGFARIELLFDPDRLTLTSVVGTGPLLPVTTSTLAEANATGRIVIARRAAEGALPSGQLTLATLHFGTATDLAEQLATVAVDPAGVQIVTGAAVEVPATAPAARIGLNPAPATCVTVADITAGECDALKSFYSATAGAHWGNWFAGGTACADWVGVDCDGGHVTGMRLPGRAIGGTLPPALGKLSYLEELDLSGNDLRGPLPSAIGGLARLRSLNLRANRLEGPLPASLATLPALLDVDIGYNLLVASDPQVANFLGVRDPDWARTQTVPPTGLDVATATSTALNLVWQAVPATIAGGFYELYLAQAAAGPFHFQTATTGTGIATLAFRDLAPDTTYYLKLRTVSPAGDLQRRTLFSTFSEVISGTTPLSPPAGVRATHGTFADRVRLTWDPVPGAGRYLLYRALAGSSEQTLLATVIGTTYEDTGTADRTFYSYWLASCNEQLCSEFSSQATGWRGTLPAIFLPHIDAGE